MMRLALASLRSRLTAFLGTFVAATLAVTLIGGAGLLLFSVLTASPSTHRFDTADVMVSGDRAITLQTIKKKGDKVKTKTKSERLVGAPSLPDDWYAKVAAVPGVATVTPDHSFPVVLTTPDGVPVRVGTPTIAHGWASAALTPFRLRSGHAPNAGEIVVDAALARSAGLAPGAELRLVTRSGERTVRLSGVAAPEHSDTLVEQAAVFVTDAEAATVSGPTAFAVTAAPGTSTDDLADRIRDTLGTETVHTGPAKVNADLPGALPDYIGAISIFGFVIGITTFATIFVLTGTVSLAIRQRLRELALLRATGATPRQLWQLLRSEVLVVTLAATVVGAPLGMVAAGLIAARFRDLGAVPAQFDVRVNVGVLLAAGLVTVIVARCSARLASRQAIRVTPAQAMRETVVETRGGLLPRVFIALVCAVGAATILGVVPLDGPFGMGMTFISSALLLCALGAAGPLVVRMLGEIGARLSGTTGITGWLAGAFTRAENRRVTAVAVPLALMFAINAPMLLNGSLTADLAQEQERLRTAPATAIATGALPLDDVGRMADLVDMAATIPTRLIVDEGGKPEDYQANGLLMAGDDAPLDLGYVAGGWREDGLSVSSYLARARGWHVGQEVSLWLPDGTQSRLRLTGVYDRSRGFGDLVAPARLVAEHDPKGLVTTVRLRGDVATVSERFPTLRVDPVATAARAGDADKQQGAWEIMIVISLGFTAIAVINTFAIAASARRNQFAQLRLIGATRRQVRQMASRETLLAVAVGLALGITVTSLVVAAFSLAQDGTLRLVVDPIAYGALSGLVALLGLAAGIIPARMVIRTVR